MCIFPRWFEYALIDLMPGIRIAMRQIPAFSHLINNSNFALREITCTSYCENFSYLVISNLEIFLKLRLIDWLIPPASFKMLIKYYTDLSELRDANWLFIDTWIHNFWRNFDQSPSFVSCIHSFMKIVLTMYLSTSVAYHDVDLYYILCEFRSRWNFLPLIAGADSKAYKLRAALITRLQLTLATSQFISWRVILTWRQRFAECAYFATARKEKEKRRCHLRIETARLSANSSIKIRRIRSEGNFHGLIN